MTHAPPPRICRKCCSAIERQSAQTALGYDAKFCKHGGVLDLLPPSRTGCGNRVIRRRRPPVSLPPSGDTGGDFRRRNAGPSTDRRPTGNAHASYECLWNSEIDLYGCFS